MIGVKVGQHRLASSCTSNSIRKVLFINLTSINLTSIIDNISSNINSNYSLNSLHRPSNVDMHMPHPVNRDNGTAFHKHACLILKK